jgi:hypothetical protein
MVGGSSQPDEGIAQQLKSLFSNSILPAATQAGALIVDGTPPGTMKLLGDCLAFRRNCPTVVGVAPIDCVTIPGSDEAPDGRVSLDMNHSAFVLCPGAAWGSEWPARQRFTTAICDSLPLIAVLVNGDEAHVREVLACVRRRLQVLVVEGTGGLADRIAGLKKPGADLTGVSAELQEIVRTGNLRVVHATDAQDAWPQAIEGRSKDDQTLQNVWNEFHRWDVAAMSYQKQFRRLQWAAAGLAVGATLCAIVQPDWNQIVAWKLDSDPRQLAWHYAVIAIPILTSILFAWMNHFRPGNRWLLLRGGAESIKREIFKYRARAGFYNDALPGPYRATRLAQEVDGIMKSLVQSDANRAGEPELPPRTEGAPDSLDALTGDDYVEERLKDQIGYYERTTRKLDRATKRFHTMIYVGGGAGAFLAAVGVNKWVALTTAIVTALTAKMESEQQENSLIQYKQALASLRTILNWWTSLSAPEKNEQRHMDRLVADTEAALAGELAGWVQQMQAAVDKAQKAAEVPPEPATPTAPEPRAAAPAPAAPAAPEATPLLVVTKKPEPAEALGEPEPEAVEPEVSEPAAPDPEPVPAQTAAAAGADGDAPSTEREKNSTPSE